MDLLFITDDSEFKYALSVVDIVSRYKAELLKTKKAKGVTKAIQKISERLPLIYPMVITVDKRSRVHGGIYQTSEKSKCKNHNLITKGKGGFCRTLQKSRLPINIKKK